MQEKENFRALTQSQLSLWTGQKLSPEVPLYNMAHSFDIKGLINTSYFSRAFSELVKRVDILRMVFSEIENIPQQYVMPEYDFSLEVLDFSDKDETAIKDWLRERGQINFDFSKPLFDSVLIKVNKERHIWFLNVHHLVTDATTSTILYTLQTELYHRACNEILEETPDVLSFMDYISFEKKQKDSDLSDTIREHWKAKLATLSKVPEFYGKKANNANSEALRVRLDIGSDRTQKLKELAQKVEIRSWTQDLTLFNLLATTLFIFIHRVTGQNSLAIGAPSHNRASKNFKRTPGLFIEIFPLLTDFQSTDTYSSVLNRVKIETNEYLRYAQPGMVTSEISRSFNVILNYINTSFSDFDGMSMQSEWIHPNHCDPNHHLRCSVHDMDGSGEISLYFDLNTSIFDASLFEKVPKHFLKVIDGLIDDINQSVYRPSLEDFISEPHTRPILEYDSIIAQFEKQVKINPSNTAIRFKTNSYSFTELNQNVNRLANYLSEKGIASEKKVALYLDRSPAYIFSVLAVLKTGASFIPISSDQPAQRVSYILKDADCALVLTNARLRNKIETEEIEIVDFSEISQKFDSQEVEFNSKPLQKEDLAYMIYTSGSTGNPKGVLISNGALYNYLGWAKSFYATDEKFIFPLFTSIGFDLTITSTFLPLLTGGELLIYNEADHGPDISLTEVLAQNEVNSIKLTPSHLALIKGVDMRNSKIKTMIVGGEDFKTHLAKAIHDSFHPNLRIFNEYGPTEATVGCIVAQFDKNKHTNSSVPIGIPIDGMHAVILDSHLNRVPDGVIAPLYLSGLGLANGYQNLPELTQTKFGDSPFSNEEKLYQTGDLARINENGEFEYLGRVDEQVKLRGFRLELTDIESNLVAYDQIENAAVVLIESGFQESGESESEQKKLVGYYTGKSKIPSAALANHLKQQLPEYMIPTYFKYIEELPLTKNGKVDKTALKSLHTFKLDMETPFVAPNGEIEELVADIWKEVLHLKQVSVHNNFIALGGDSLAAIRVTARINEEVQMKFPLNKIFELPTIAEYAIYIEETLVKLLNE